MSADALERLQPPHAEAQDFDKSERLYYDTATWLAEVLPGQMRTPFEYTFDGHELYGEDGGALKPIFEDAIADAAILAQRDPRLKFEVRRRDADHEMGEYRDMLSMMRGDLPNTMITVSDFPPELMNATEDVGGYNTSRKQTMLRVIAKTPQGTLTMISQSLDRSDRKSLEAIFAYFGRVPEPGELLGQRIHVDLPGEEQEFLADWLTGVYDRSMTEQHGGEWYAGRTPAELENTYDFVLAQQDLLTAFMLETKRRGTDPSLRYGLAAAMRARFKKKTGNAPHISIEHTIDKVLDEIGEAGYAAQLQGLVFSACGDTLSQFNALGFGNQTDQYGSLSFTCPFGHSNTRERGQRIPFCLEPACFVSVRC